MTDQTTGDDSPPEPSVAEQTAEALDAVIRLQEAEIADLKERLAERDATPQDEAEQNPAFHDQPAEDLPGAVAGNTHQELPEIWTAIAALERIHHSTEGDRLKAAEGLRDYARQCVAQDAHAVGVPAVDLHAAFELLRRRIYAQPRFSFWLSDPPGVKRVPDKHGRWIDVADAAALCEFEQVEAMLAPGSTAAPAAPAEPVMFNGLTEAETSASASVCGLTRRAEPVNAELLEALKKTREVLSMAASTYNDYWERGMDIIEPETDEGLKVADAAIARAEAALKEKP